MVIKVCKQLVAFSTVHFKSYRHWREGERERGTETERRKQTKREWYRKESEKNERKSDGSARTPAISSPSRCPSVL